MIFLGDIAIPDSKVAKDFIVEIEEFKSIFTNKTTVANFEGALIHNSEKYRSQRVLFNHNDSIKVLKHLNVKIVSLANNHIGDIQGGLNNTLEILEGNKIISFGAGFNEIEASRSKEININGRKYFFIGCCWDLMLNIIDNSVVVNKLEPLRLLEDIKQLRSKHPEACIIVMPHWNFDMELYPFPMYRQLSRALIDSGANAIIGSHSHCVQGIEVYKGSPIAYCLGNFILPDCEYFDFKLKYPDFVKTQLAIEWDPDINEIFLHWFRYSFEEGKHRLKHITSEKISESSKIKQLTPYRNLSNVEYAKWFKQNRRKNFMLPIYKDYKEVKKNYLFDVIIRNRLYIARKLASSGLRSGIE
ncbi:MAG: CapA family protein [Tissierellaceae bacterium]|nr:CapA family protein [Tissierellaceae bacterium]